MATFFLPVGSIYAEEQKNRPALVFVRMNRRITPEVNRVNKSNVRFGEGGGETMLLPSTEHLASRTKV